MSERATLSPARLRELAEQAFADARSFPPLLEDRDIMWVVAMETETGKRALVAFGVRVLRALAAAPAAGEGTDDPDVACYGNALCVCGHTSARHACDHEWFDYRCSRCDCDGFRAPLRGTRGPPMTAQREALIARLEAHVRKVRENWSPGLVCGLWPEVLDMEAAIAALRASAPLAPDGADGDSMASATRKDAARPAMADGNASIESPSASTAIGEPPTGMREVPGTPGLYEVGEAAAGDEWSVGELAAIRADYAAWLEKRGRCALCGGPSPTHCNQCYGHVAYTSLADPDLDALARETVAALQPAHSVSERVVIIRAALDRVKEGK